MWCIFQPIGMCFFACKHVLLVDTFAREARVDRSFLHQTCRKPDGNVCEKTWQALFTTSPFLLGLSTRFKNWYIVWRPQRHMPEPRLAEAASCCYVILNWSRDLDAPARPSTEEVGRGGGLCIDWLCVHVAMVNNASGFVKSFPKQFINGIIVFQTNPTLHTLKPRSSHVENLRSVWSWSAEIFEAHKDRQTDRQISCFYREMTCDDDDLYLEEKQTVTTIACFLCHLG